MIFKIFTFLSMTFVTLLLLWVCGLIWFSASISMSKPEQPSVKADAIIALTGGTKRIEEALNILKQHEPSELFISGVNPDVKESDIIGSKNEKLCCITLGYMANNTQENAEEVKQWIETQDIQSIRLVTSNYHMPRSVLEFKKLMPNLTIFKHAVKPNNYSLINRKFWPITFSEYNKMLLTWLHFNQA
ncbi:MAG: YdcF family protein [Pseudomonadota bacterium]